MIRKSTILSRLVSKKKKEKIIATYLLIAYTKFFLFFGYCYKDNGKQYVIGTDVGVFVGHTGPSSKPQKVLSIAKVSQVQVLEEAQLLLVLADRTLWEYSLNVLNNKPDQQSAGRRVQGHVPHFHVGTSLNRKLVCVPKVSTLSTTITLFEPSRPQELLLKNKKFLGKLVRIPASDIHLKRFKDCYVPSEAWAVELSASLMLITCPRGIVMVDLQTSKPQRKFITITIILICEICVYMQFCVCM